MKNGSASSDSKKEKEPVLLENAQPEITMEESERFRKLMEEEDCPARFWVKVLLRMLMELRCDALLAWRERAEPSWTIRPEFMLKLQFLTLIFTPF